MTKVSTLPEKPANEIRFETAYNYPVNKYLGEINLEPSLTVPDMALSIQELLRNFTNSPELQRSASFDDEDINFEDEILSKKNFDLVDIENATNYIEVTRQLREDAIQRELERQSEAEQKEIAEALKQYRETQIEAKPK